MKHTIAATPEQASRLRTSGAMLLPMEPQPTHGSVFQISGDESGDWYTQSRDNLGRLLDGRWSPPYQPGDVLEWESRTVVQNNFNGRVVGVLERFCRTVASCVPRLLGKLTVDELILLPIEDGHNPFDTAEEWWNREYPAHPWSPGMRCWFLTFED